MNKKSQKSLKTSQRVLAYIFTFIILCVSFSCFPSSVAAEVTTIKNIEPYILANKNDTITLSDYSVEFSDGTVSGDISWSYNDSEVTTISVAEATVYPLVAKSGDKTQNIYIVAKESSKTEYVLYYNDFSAANAIDDWNNIADDSIYTINDGKLVINDATGSNPRTYLPSWLSDFGNYRIDAVATQAEAADASRWFSFIYRADNADTTGAPYYHMAVRNNMATAATATTGGIECCSNTGTWTYYKSSSYSEAVNASKYYTFSVLAKDSVIQYQVDGNIVIHVDDLPKISTDSKGGIGLQANSSKLIVDSLKITVQKDTPVYTEPEVKQVMQYVENPESNILNTPTNIAVIDSIETLEGLQEGKPSNALMYVDSYLNVNNADGANITTVETALPYLGTNIIPAFYVKDNATIDALVTLLDSKNIKDVLVVSSDTEVAKYALKSYPVLRTAIDYTSLYSEEISEEKLLEIRRSVTSANSLIAILPVSHATTKNVYYLQSLGVTVWIYDFYTLNDTDIAKMITSGATGIITNDYKRVASSFKTLFAENTLAKTPLIIGHRGNPTQAPENSVSGYLKAVENGADVVETDIYLTKDNKIVIMHDGEMTRTTSYNGTTKIEQMTLEEIKEYFLWSDNDKFKSTYPEEKVPTLEEMFVALKDSDCKIFLEIKSGNVKLIQPTVDLIKQYGYEDRIFVICFGAAQIKAFRTAMPTIGTGFLTSVGAFTSVPTMHDSLYQSYLGYHAINSTYNPNLGNLNGDLMAALRHRGVTCWPWTYSVSAADSFNKAFLWGIDGITTNDAQYSKNMVKQLVTSANKIDLTIDGTSIITAEKVTYGDVIENIIGDEKAFVKFIEGEDVIKYENGTITALKNGTASFMIGYTTKTATGSEYVLYTQPFEINVNELEPVSVAADNNSLDKTLIIVSIVVIVVALSAVLFVLKRKNKAA